MQVLKQKNNSGSAYVIRSLPSAPEPTRPMKVENVRGDISKHLYVNVHSKAKPKPDPTRALEVWKAQAEERRETIRKMYADGMRRVDIEKALGVSRGTVYLALKGVTCRKQSS